MDADTNTPTNNIVVTTGNDKNTKKIFIMDGEKFRVKRFTRCSGEHKHIDGVRLYYITLECNKSGIEISIEGKKEEMLDVTTPSIKEAGN